MPDKHFERTRKTKSEWKGKTTNLGGANAEWAGASNTKQRGPNGPYGVSGSWVGRLQNFGYEFDAIV